MRRQVALTAALFALALPAAASAADDSLQGYTTTVTKETAAILSDVGGVDLGHTIDPREQGAQEVFVALDPAQAEAVEAAGLELEKVLAATLAPEGAVRDAQRRGLAKPETGGDSPNFFYDVFRTYSEPGGIADELRALAQQYPGYAKLVRIGTSGLGKPILALKVTKDARNLRDGERPAVLYSGVNHAREWIAAETARRMPTWFLEHRNVGKTAAMLERAELWFLPIQNPDGYDYTFTCGQGVGTTANRPCGATLNPATGTYRYEDAAGAVQTANNRLWRKTLRNNNADALIGNPGDGVDPNRNYPTAWGLDPEGASNTPGGETYRGPFPLSEPENLAYDRLLRKVTPEAVINYHSAAQLLLYPFGYITDVSTDDNPWFVALTGTDGDAAVDPYISQRSSDLYVTNGETTDHVYNKYRGMAWTPELDECETAAGGTFCTGGSGFTFPDDEGKVQAVFEKNLDFARNVAETTTATDRPDRPVQANEDQSSYQVKATPDIEPRRFGVSYGSVQPVEATVRRALGPVDVQYSVSGPGGAARTITIPATEWRGGERFGDLRGKYYRRVRAVNPVEFRNPGTTTAPRPLVANDVVNVTVRAGGQQQRFTYRVVSTRPAGTAKRVLIVAAEDYTGVSPNKTAYDTAPRYASLYAGAVPATGYTVETYNIDSPPAGAAGAPGTKYLSQLGVLQHFDAVVYETGDDLIPQDTTETVTDATYRRATGFTGTTTQTTTFGGSLHAARYGPRNWQALRDYMNEGGKLVYAGRNLWTPQTSTSTGLTAYSGYTWWQEPVFGFNYPLNQAGDDDRPGTAFFRELDISNDFGQYFLGVGARVGGPNTTTINTASASPVGTGGAFDGIGPVAIDSTTGAGGFTDPTQDPATGAATPVVKTPQRLRSMTSLIGAEQRPIRQERVELDYAGQASTTGGAAISTADSISFGFGFEQTDAATRALLMERTLAYLLPTTADTTAPTASFLRPATGAQVTPRDPVEIEVEAADERGDLKEVRLRVDGTLVATKVSFPFQFRYDAPASAVGSTVTMTAEAEDKAGNVTTVTRDVVVVASAADVESPVPTGRPTITGTPEVGSTLTCVPPAFDPGATAVTYQWLRDGEPIVGASGAGYLLTLADQGATVACVATGGNEAGSGDATSLGKVVSGAAGNGPTGPTGQNGADGADGAPGPTGPAGQDGANGAAGPTGPAGSNGQAGSTGPAGANGQNGADGPAGTNGQNGADGPAGPTGPAGPAGPKGPKGSAANVRVTCRLVRRRTAIRCQVKAAQRSLGLTARVRLVGQSAVKQARGRGRLAVIVRSTAGRLERGAPVAVRVRTSQGATVRAKVPAGASRAAK